MTVIRVNLDEYTRRIFAASKQFPFAAKNALNDTAFRLKKDLEAHAPDDMNFRVGSKAALGIGLKKANPKNLTAVVGTSREWIVSQVNEGINKPTKGFDYKGGKYLFVPNEDRVTARGRGDRKTKKVPSGSRVFVQRVGKTLVLMAQNRRGLVPLGILVKQSDYGNEFGWERQVQRTIDRHFGNNFARNLDEALATAR